MTDDQKFLQKYGVNVDGRLMEPTEAGIYYMSQSPVVTRNTIPVDVLRHLVGKIIIPKNVNQIKKGAFSTVKSKLRELVFEKRDQRDLVIDNNAFADFKLLNTVLFSNPLGEAKNVQGNLSDGAFKNCISLEEIYLGKIFKRIGDSAFENCSSLREIKIPNTVTYVGDNAFKGCTNARIIFSYWSPYVGPEKVSRTLIKQRIMSFGIDESQVFFSDKFSEF